MSEKPFGPKGWLMVQDWGGYSEKFGTFRDLVAGIREWEAESFSVDGIYKGTKKYDFWRVYDGRTLYSELLTPYERKVLLWELYGLQEVDYE